MLNQEGMLALAVNDLKEKIIEVSHFYAGLKVSHAADGLMCAIHKEEDNHIIKIDYYIQELNAWLLNPTPSTYTLQLKRFEIVIDRLAHPSLRTDRGKTPLMLATMGKYEHVAMAMLLSPQVNINAKDNQGKTVLDFAARQKLDKVLDRLFNPTLGPRIDKELITTKLAKKGLVTFGEYNPLGIKKDQFVKPILKHKY
jgi:hypothetical protein